MDMVDTEILGKYVDLGDAFITDRQKKYVNRILLENKDAFSMTVELNHCPNIEVERELAYTTPLY